MRAVQRKDPRRETGQSERGHMQHRDAQGKSHGTHTCWSGGRAVRVWRLQLKLRREKNSQGAVQGRDFGQPAAHQPLGGAAAGGSWPDACCTRR